MKILNAVFLVAGLVALVVMVVGFGPALIGRTFIGSWSVILAAAAVLATGLLAGSAGWWLLLPREIRPRLADILPAHLAGYALNRLLPTGNMGELARIGLLQHIIPARELTAALMVSTLIGTLIGQVFALVGSIIALVALPMSAWVGLTMLAIASGMILFTVGVLFLLRFQLFGRLTAFLARLKWFSRLHSLIARMQRLDFALVRVSSLGRRDTVRCIAVLIFVRLTHLMSGTLVVSFILPSLPLFQAFLVTFVLGTAGQLISWVLAVIPQGLGAVEGGNAAILAAMGLDPALGISIALCKRAAGLIVSGLSLLGFLAPAPAAAALSKPTSQTEPTGE
jgi:hypothetical protein